MKKTLAMVLAAALLLAGCSAGTAASTGEASSTAASASQTTALAPGTYQGAAMGMKGDVTVEVTLDDSGITAIEVVECVDTPVISDAAIDALPQQIVETQSLKVDNVSGATMTSLGIKNAVKDALTQAGADAAQFDREVAAAQRTTGETQQYDIVVVGSGMAGLSAAIQAARADSSLSVLVLEKEAYTGGSSRVCGGGLWAVNSSINEQIGQDCTKEEYISFMQQRSGTQELNLPLMENLYDTSAEVIEYYVDNGLPVSLETWSLGHPDSKLPVLWSTNNGQADWETGDSGLIDAVQTMAEDLGVEIRLNSKVTALNTEGDAVTGVTVEDQESTYAVQAQKVLLATGGFTRSTEYIAEYASEYENAFAFTGAGSTGDGLTLTKDLGVSVVGEGMMGLYGVNANYGYYGSNGNLVWLPQLYVNAEGETFGMETTFYGDTLALLLAQTDSHAFGIFDSTTAVTERLEQAAEKGLATRYDTLEELAEDQGIDAANLLATAQARDLADGPYYCMTVRPLFIGSIPGLEVDEGCRVLADGQPIANLYACGELIFGNVFQGQYPASGTGMGTSAYTGALAAKTACADLAA